MFRHFPLYQVTRGWQQYVRNEPFIPADEFRRALCAKIADDTLLQCSYLHVMEDGTAKSVLT